MKKTVRHVLLSAIFIFVLSCSTTPLFRYKSDQVVPPPPSYPHATFAVFSDPHLHTAALGMSGQEFRTEVNEGKKLLHLSEEIFTTVADALSRDPSVQFVLIPGDLTKDGELTNHRRMRTILDRLEKSGKQVFVVPGNHDINNFYARRYTDHGSIAEPSVTPQEFRTIYAAFGYDEAVALDPNSLSYIAEPVPGLWLFGLDACTYEKNSPRTPSSVSGKFKSTTLLWIEEKLIEARQKEKAVIGFMHHGVLEHFASQKKYFPAYVVDDPDAVSELFAAYGMRFVFTGHFHAQDVTLRRFRNRSFLFDIETSSLITYPCAYRIVRFRENDETQLETRTIVSLPSHRYFSHYALAMLWIGVSNFLEKRLISYGFSREEMRRMIPDLVKGLVAHTSGDEDPPPVLVRTAGLSLKALLVLSLTRDLIEGAWHDLPPPDNDLIIDTREGTWKKKEKSLPVK